MMKTTARVLALLLLVSATIACGDDDSNNDTAPNNDTGNNDVNNDQNNDQNNDVNNDQNNDVNNDENNDVDSVDACQAQCEVVAACQDIVDLCGDLVPQVVAGCQQACAEDEDARGQINATIGLECSVVAPLAISGFELDELCGDEPPDEEPIFSGVVTLSDFATGTDIVLYHELEDGFEAIGLLNSEGTDVVARSTGGTEVAVLDRTSATLTLLDTADEGVTRTEISLEEGSNPQDIHRIGDHYVLASLQGTDLIIFDNGFTQSTLDLSGVNADDTDGNPEMYAIFDLGEGKAGVLLQNLTNFASVGSSYIAVVDVATATLDRAVELPGGNPFSFFVQEDGVILIALIENFSDQTGQVIAYDPSDDSITEGIFTEEAVGGDINSFAPADDGFLVAISTPEFTTSLVHLSGNGELTEVLATAGFDVGNVDRVNGFLVATTAEDPAGLLVFDVADATTPLGEPRSFFELPPRAFFGLK